MIECDGKMIIMSDRQGGGMSLFFVWMAYCFWKRFGKGEKIVLDWAMPIEKKG